jgi:hypothetical protein
MIKAKKNWILVIEYETLQKILGNGKNRMGIKRMHILFILVKAKKKVKTNWQYLNLIENKRPAINIQIRYENRERL